MTSQYFDNSASQESWGDDWGDFNDDSNIITNAPPPPTTAVSNNPYSSGSLAKNINPPMYGQQPAPPTNQYPTINNNPTPSHVQRPPPSGYAPQPNLNYSQQLQHPPPPQQQHFSAPQQYSNQNWNWNPTDQPTSLSENIDNVFPKVSPAAVQKHATQNVTENVSDTIQQSQNNFPNNFNNNNMQNLQSRTPDELKNTQNIQNPLLSRVKRSEHLLTPQWSTESQVSQTSSDRSIESDNIDTRSSATNTSDEHGYGQSLHNQTYPLVPASTDVENNQNFQYQNYNSGYHMTDYTTPVPMVETKKENNNKEELDSLDQALMNINAVKTDDNKYYQQNFQQDIIPPPTGHAPQMTGYPPMSSTPNPAPPSISPGLPQQAQFSAPAKLATPPPANPILPPQNTNIPSIPPPSQSQQYPPQQGSAAAANPFKRSNLPTQRTVQYPVSTIPTQQTIPTSFYPDDQSNQDFNTQPPDNSENLEVENMEIAPSNDRNEYLQIGHLSEENLIRNANPHHQQDGNDNLPPPGLSRFVLGQTGNENTPPIGLDRMVPGTELNMELNVGRQADGQAASAVVPPPGPRLLERNLYPVPGESTVPSQRVIPGVEDDRRGNPLQQPQQQQQPQQPPQINQQHNEPSILINDQYREVNVEGENVSDYPNQHQQQIEIREEPIEGANTQDEIIPQAVNLNQIETESNLTYDGPRKDLSNPSTANDDSDKEHMYYKSRRGGDDGSGNRRRGSNKERGRYDTEDTDYYSDRDRSRRYREGSARDDRSDRDGVGGKDSKDRPRDRRRDDRGGSSGRDRERSDRDRYDRNDRDRNKYRYDTDSSKYENEGRDDSGKRRYDYDRRRDDRDRDDRRYRRNDRDRADRSDRRRDDRGKYRDDRHRRRDDYDEEYHHQRSNSRGGERDINEKDRRYQQGYYGQGYGQYDPYTYYQQQQQYYESLRRTNPQAYMEMYKKYFSQMQGQVPTDLMNTDGRESVHSGRSSANEKDR